MVIKKLAFILSFAFIFCYISFPNVWAQNAMGETSLTTKLLTSRSVSGAWQINNSESDDVVSKMREKISNLTTASQSTEKGNTQQSEIPSLSISLFPPETLMLIVGDDAPSVTINEGFKDVVLTRSFPTDGMPQIYEIHAGVNFTVKAFQKGSNVVVETASPRGNKMTETYSLADGGNKLNVTIHVESSKAEELLNLHRVYDRAKVDFYPDANASGDIL